MNPQTIPYQQNGAPTFNFANKLAQSQKDATLPRWELAYQQYFHDMVNLYNTDTTNKGLSLQSQGVDHIVATPYQLYFIDFILIEKPYPNVFVEYEVNGNAGKFMKTNQLCTHIAYSHRPHSTVQIFEFDEMHTFLKQSLFLESFETKTAQSSKDGRSYEAKGLIIPTSAVRENLPSYEMIFIEG